MKGNYVSFPKLQWPHRWILEMGKWNHPTFYSACDYSSMLGFQLIHVSKRDFCMLWTKSITDCFFSDSYGAIINENVFFLSQQKCWKHWYHWFMSFKISEFLVIWNLNDIFFLRYFFEISLCGQKWRMDWIVICITDRSLICFVLFLFILLIWNGSVVGKMLYTIYTHWIPWDKRYLRGPVSLNEG